MINKHDAHVDHCSLHKHSFPSLNFQLLELQWTVTKHHTGFPIHTTAAAVTVMQWLLMGWRWEIGSHCPGTKGELSLTASAFCYTMQLMHCATLPYRHQHMLWGQQGRGMRSCSRTKSQKHSTHVLQVSAVSNSQLYQWGHSNNFHMETPRATEGFTNKVTKISKHIPRLSFSHELSGNIYGNIPSYLWNKAIFIYRKHRGGEKEPKKPSNWKDGSTSGTMKNNNINQGAGVCLASRETWQTKDPAS